MTDDELKGIAAQAYNLAKLDRERGQFNFLLASYTVGEGLYRMKRIEAFIVKKLGEDWLNHGATKDIGFGMIRAANETLPVDAIVFATAINKFGPSKRLLAMKPKERAKFAHPTSADECRRLVERGLMTIQDSMMCNVQTPKRICMYVRAVEHGRETGDPAEVTFFDTDKFDGRLKMFGKRYEYGQQIEKRIEDFTKDYRRKKTN